ncbi:hypothetical protein XANCAGTX0491_002480 [Xanthoria calcicola]
MHLVSLTTLALASSFITPSFAAPAQENALVGRQGPSDAPAALAMVKQLYVDVKQYTAVINSTAAGLSKRDTAENKANSAKTFRTAIASINKLVVKTTSDIKKMPGSPAGKLDRKSSTALAERQSPPPDPTGLAAALMMLLLEIGGALNNIIAALGLAATLALLGPLVTSLSMLLAALLPVVNNLLTLLGGLLNGVLGGLSMALAGLGL